jgi:hypothetical protein
MRKVFWAKIECAHLWYALELFKLYAFAFKSFKMLLLALCNTMLLVVKFVFFS